MYLLLLSLSCWVLLFHPFVIYPLSLLLLRRIRGEQPLRESGAPARASIDIVFCAYNEIRVIEAKLANCLAIAARHPEVKVHVYSDGSTDGTAQILHRFADRVRVVVSAERTGKATGMNRLLAGCRGQIVLFTDANVILNPEGIGHLQRYFADPEVGCVCGHLIYTNAAESTTATLGSLYWRLEELIKNAESATGSVMGADGSVFAIRRDLYREVAADVIDDMFTSLSILCDGRRVIRAPELLAFERSATSAHEEFRRKVRIACRGFNCHRALWPRLRRLGALDLYKYLSHKFIRWLAIVWLLLGLAAGAAYLATLGVTGLRMALLVAMSALILVGGYSRFTRVARALLDLLGAFAATGYGVWRSLRGDKHRTWEVAQTVR